MKALLLFAVLLFGLTMCRPREEKLVKLDELIQKSETGKEGIQQVEDESEEEKLLRRFRRNTFDFDSVRVLGLKERLFPSRFGPDTSLMLQFTGAKGVVKYYRWTFTDSTRVMNALLNWLDCFGPTCKAFRIGEEANFQRNPMQVLLNDTTLIYIDSEYPDFENWLTLHDSLGFGREWDLYIEQGKGGKAKWYTFEEKKKQKLKP